jgi:hypothetical protein
MQVTIANEGVNTEPHYHQPYATGGGKATFLLDTSPKARDGEECSRTLARGRAAQDPDSLTAINVSAPRRTRLLHGMVPLPSSPLSKRLGEINLAAAYSGLCVAGENALVPPVSGRPESRTKSGQIVQFTCQDQAIKNELLHSREVPLLQAKRGRRMLLYSI